MPLYKKKNHAVSALYAHVVLTIKYRRPALSEPDIARTVIVSIRRTALMLNCEIEAIESDANHLHILLRWPPSISLSTLIQQIKGRSAREVRINERQKLRPHLWGKHFWSPSYCVISCGGAPLSVIKRYVEEQGKEP